MLRFLTYWLLALLLTLPSWWIVAVEAMADVQDLLWTAGFATLLAAVLSLRSEPRSARSRH